MRKLALALCAATALVGVNATSSAMAGPASTGAVPSLPDSGIEEAQYRWHGRSYCFYPNGWQGPGWYRCGWQHRRGMGWGGPMGWRGWDAPGRSMHRERPRERDRDRDMDRSRERAPQRGMERAPERGAAPGGTERRPPAGGDRGERGAAPAGERGAAPGVRAAPGGERRTEPGGGGERPKDVRPPAGAPGGGGGGGGAPAGGGASPGPN